MDVKKDYDKITDPKWNSVLELVYAETILKIFEELGFGA